MNTIKFIPRDPIKPLFAIKISPTLQKVLNTLFDEKEKLNLLKNVLGINPKRVVGLKNVLDEKKNNGTIVIIYDYIYEKIMPKYDIPCDNNGFFKFKIYDMDFNTDINIESLLNK
ncbi:MAG: hypothetical protein WBG30_02535 [Psychrilyobacter sp.]|uniref:hypothetical protein n=1 Tax=Psychrilyobacter sp. TaxID=2586924 RepID=UPI003C717CD5